MARRRGWMVMAAAPVLCGAIISACTNNVDYPPLYGPYGSGSGGGGGGQGGGEGGGNNPCVAQGGQCTTPGNATDGGSSCPVSLPYSCGPGSVTEAGEPVLVCCGGYNDAGAPDVIVDAPKQ